MTKVIQRWPGRGSMAKSKPVYRAWGVLFDGDLVCFGNGAQHQLPLFHSRKEAVAWKREQAGWMVGRLAVVRVEVHHAEK